MRHIVCQIIAGLVFGFGAAAISTLNMTDWSTYVERIKKALRMTGLDSQDAYTVMGINQAQFRRQLLGQEKLTHNDTMLLPPQFHANHALLTLAHYGPPEVMQQSVKVASWLESGRFNLVQGDN